MRTRYKAGKKQELFVKYVPKLELGNEKNEKKTGAWDRDNTNCRGEVPSPIGVTAK